MTTSSPETCSQCGQVILRGQTPYLRGAHILCKRCFQQTQAGATTPAVGPGEVVGTIQIARVKADSIPEYMVLDIVGTLIRIAALVALVLGLGAVVVGVGIAVVKPSHGNNGFSIVFTGGGVVIYGVLTLALAQLIHSWRDVARNSWRVANAIAPPNEGDGRGTKGIL